MMDKEFEEWKAERDWAMAGTLEEFTTYAIKMGQIPSDPAIFEVMYHKCRTANMTIDPAVRQTSKDWLIERGYTSLD